jgi:hypothetical protein
MKKMFKFPPLCRIDTRLFIDESRQCHRIVLKGKQLWETVRLIQ